MSKLVDESGVVLVDLNVGPFPVIQTGAPQFRIIQDKAQWFDQVQPAACIGAKSDDIAGIRRNLR